jgi:uncharacterized protein
LVVISDTSPITNLIAIGRLGLLNKLFVDIVVPIGVYNELIEIPRNETTLKDCNWIHVRETRNLITVAEFLNDLDQGEAEAISIAIELKADLVLIDEKLGRRIAEENGLKITGLLGVLQRAKLKAFIDEVKPILDQLIEDTGFRVHPKLYKEVLISVNEHPSNK